MTQLQYLNELKKNAEVEYKKGNFIKAESMFEEYNDKYDSYKKLKEKMAA